jgi:hypothetical protein
MMFFNLGVGCFVFSHANLGLSCSPVGERTEAVEHTYVFFKKSVTFIFGCVSWCENNDFNHVLKLSHLGSDIFQPMHLAKYNMLSRAEPKKTENETNMVWWNLFCLS